jgi:hypothetical protein
VIDVLNRYRGRRNESPYFWLRVLIATLGRRDILSLLRARLHGEIIASISGLEQLPDTGIFILAVNHFNGRPALDVAAAVLSAVNQRRPDAVRDIMFVVGQTARPSRGIFSRLVKIGRDWVFYRWSAHAVRVPLKNLAPSPVGLRDWAARKQSVFVFPEGKARLTFGAIRAGSGRWLAMQKNTPTIPVGVWWVRGEGWHVRFGSPIRWPYKRHLHDTQLALKLADLLPPELAPAWQTDLARWRAVTHNQRTLALSDGNHPAHSANQALHHPVL